MPNNLAKPLETVRNAVVTAIGIDFEKSEYELSLLSFVPTPTKDFVETYNINSVKGETLSDTIIKAGMHLGKDVTLFHTEIALLGKGLLEEDVSRLIDYLSREESLSNSCIMIAAGSSAKDMLKFLKEKDLNPSERLRELMHYNAEHVNCRYSSIETFYKGYYSPSKSSFMPYFELVDSDDGTGIMLNSTSSEGSQESSSQESKKQEIKFYGKVAVFREGKLRSIFSPEVVRGMNWLSCQKTQENIVIDNYSDDELTNAKVVYFLSKKQIIKNASFENGVPVLTISLKLYLDRVEIHGDRNELKKTIQLDNINEKISRELENKIKGEMALALSNLRENKTDLVDFYSDFYLKQRKEYKKYLKNLDDEEDFLNGMILQVNIKIEAD